MKLYRVFPRDPNAAVDAPGGALFAPPSSVGRFDNPDLYRGLYCSTSPEGAIGERFATLRAWRPQTFLSPHGTYALATIESHDLHLADLSNVASLVSHEIRRVVDVVTRDRTTSQPLAARIFHEGSSDGLEWWSGYLADWTNVLVWHREKLTLAAAPELLSVNHPAVIAAADALPRTLHRS